MVSQRFLFFKQKTAYEMLRSLVGSEMCIRDRSHSNPDPASDTTVAAVKAVAILVGDGSSFESWDHVRSRLRRPGFERRVFTITPEEIEPAVLRHAEEWMQLRQDSFDKIKARTHLVPERVLVQWIQAMMSSVRWTMLMHERFGQDFESIMRTYRNLS
eukprot:TRINITY_DN61667_c0_g1_i1.p1 TRINITY_DN61667_c0_g1~~TRINITY_DN61667_c0_g1_i1.p1  ORF type:complete len:158 (+),score=32.98 TRINITY_DN61667_c0_g1_i1:92-565(+)